FVGVYNTDIKENNAFLYFARHFHEKKLPVPEVLYVNFEKDVYFLEDLGDTTLYQSLKQNDLSFSDEIIKHYKLVINDLISFQITGTQDVSFDLCYPRAQFDKQSILWDLWYFKYYFLKLARTDFDEQNLEDNFNYLVDILLQANYNYFMYRDFQSENIMIKENKPYYIDFQGGRQGSLFYDLASLLYDSKVNMPFNIKEELSQVYLAKAIQLKITDKKEISHYYHYFILIRLLQAMGAYGFRGIYEKKAQFLRSIPFALRDLNDILNHYSWDPKIEYLIHTLKKMLTSRHLAKYNPEQFNKKISVQITSFSYNGRIPEHIPDIRSFFFDCRLIGGSYNIGLNKKLTGLDEEVKLLLLKDTEVLEFLKGVYSILENALMCRDVNKIMVNFGSQNGRHRSVFCAESLKLHLKEIYKLEVSTHHFTLEKDSMS
ncbi:MAG: phosphotransferase, partial [Spirochaetota bacterium]|nr:phosphotransferase [Spirochaetota bacterium]